MDEKILPSEDLPDPAEQRAEDLAVAERRAFFRRAVAVGIPVVLATVRGRSVHAQTVSGCGSLQPSGCTDGLIIGEDISKPAGAQDPTRSKPGGTDNPGKRQKPQ
jgi:hypothetical protein